MADEYITKEQAIAMLCCDCSATMDCRPGERCADYMRIKDIPSADVTPVRHGRWNEESPDCLDGDSVYVCSVCGETWTLIEGTPLDNNMHYCPNCGARMEQEADT